MLERKNLYKIYSNCRRGMLELDMVLINFLDKHYIKLTNYEKNLLLTFLNESDENIYNWIIKKNNNYEQHYHNIITKIKKSIYE